VKEHPIVLHDWERYHWTLHCFGIITHEDYWDMELGSIELDDY